MWGVDDGLNRISINTFSTTFVSEISEQIMKTLENYLNLSY
jgi:hypothetical protein